MKRGQDQTAQMASMLLRANKSKYATGMKAPKTPNYFNKNNIAYMISQPV
jgi:hypothetical protein